MDVYNGVRLHWRQTISKIRCDPSYVLPSCTSAPHYTDTPDLNRAYDTIHDTGTARSVVVWPMTIMIWIIDWYTYLPTWVNVLRMIISHNVVCVRIKRELTGRLGLLSIEVGGVYPKLNWPFQNALQQQQVLLVQNQQEQQLDQLKMAEDRLTRIVNKLGTYFHSSCRVPFAII
jgi:hypothetical protein